MRREDPTGPPPLLRTRRLCLRPLRPGDETALLALYGDPQVARWLGDRTPLTLDLCRLWVALAQSSAAPNGLGLYAVEERATGELVAGCGVLHRPSAQPHPGPPELMYAVRPDRWGQGYAREAAAPLLRHVQQHTGLAQIHATVMPDNGRSLRLLQVLGFAWQHTGPDPEDGEVVSTWCWTPRVRLRSIGG